jgi:hypothetical protein
LLHRRFGVVLAKLDMRFFSEDAEPEREVEVREAGASVTVFSSYDAAPRPTSYKTL